jgi:hypothetical protein
MGQEEENAQRWRRMGHPPKNHGNPLIGNPEILVCPTHPTIGGEKTSESQKPEVAVTQDKNGNVTVNIQESVGNPYTQILDPTATIKADINVTVDEKATNAQFNGILSGSPSFEGNLSVNDGENQNVPLQSAPTNPIQFYLGLHDSNTVDQSVPLKSSPEGEP